MKIMEIFGFILYVNNLKSTVVKIPIVYANMKGSEAKWTKGLGEVQGSSKA